MRQHFMIVTCETTLEISIIVWVIRILGFCLRLLLFLPFLHWFQVLVLWQLKCPTSYYCICNLGTSLSSKRWFKQTEHNALFRSLICERSVLQYEMMFLNSQPKFMTLGLGTTAILLHFVCLDHLSCFIVMT